jgi:hypothetical protein
MHADLKEWTVAYIKNKDMTTKRLVKTEEKKECVEAQYKDKTVAHYIVEKLNDALFSSIENTTWKTIVCLNTEDNLEFLTKHWDRFSKINNLTMIFVNLKTHEKWIINPKLHAMIADPAAIKTGLRTMFDTANGKIAEIKTSKKKSPMFESNHEDEEGEEES